MINASDQGAAATASLCFTEEMKGYIAFGEADYTAAAREGHQQHNDLMFHLTICAHDVKRFVAEPQHEATAEGYIRCDVLGGTLPVERGSFNLFVDDGDPSTTYMKYRLYFKDGAGHPLTLSGFKRIGDDPSCDVWSDTTTLFTHIFQGHIGPEQEPQAQLVASGIIHILLLDFAKQLTTFRTSGPSLAARAEALLDFSKLFLGKLYDTYFHHIPAEAHTGTSLPATHVGSLSS